MRLEIHARNNRRFFNRLPLDFHGLTEKREKRREREGKLHVGDVYTRLLSLEELAAIPLNSSRIADGWKSKIVRWSRAANPNRFASRLRVH